MNVFDTGNTDAGGKLTEDELMKALETISEQPVRRGCPHEDVILPASVARKIPPEGIPCPFGCGKVLVGPPCPFG